MAQYQLFTKLEQRKDAKLLYKEMSSQYNALIATRGKLPSGVNAMSDLLAVYGLDSTQYFTAVAADRDTIKQYNLGYKNIIITQMFIVNATLPTLEVSLEEEIGFGHQDVIPDQPVQVVTMIMKQDLKNKQDPKNDKSSRTKETPGSQNALTNSTVTMVMEETIDPTVTLFIEDNGSNDDIGVSDDHTEKINKLRAHVYSIDQLSAYQWIQTT